MREGWAYYDTIYYCDGNAYGVVSDCRTVCFGKQEDVEAYLSGGEFKGELRCLNELALIKEIIQEIESNKESGNGDQLRAKQARDFRNRSARDFEHRTPSVRRAPAQKRIPVRKIKHPN